jgi:AraC family transcriptional regulator of adaptative response/methylated-DNA-[protein]-cysteine methyltransferase
MELTNDIMYEALLKKDTSFEGIFYAAIKTTGIFCRPTCTARKPKPENVVYYETPKEAILNGYRPCKICSPLNSTGDTPVYIKLLLERLTKEPYIKIKDQDLITSGIEPNRVRRWFKTNHGITFQSYQRMLRINSAYKKLVDGNTVSDAAFDNGYESLSGFSEAFKNLFGDSPSNAKLNSVINITRILTPIGPMYACASEEGICLLEFTDRRMLETEFKELTKLKKAKFIYGENEHLKELQKQLKEYFEGSRKTFDLKMMTPGTQFQNAVWKALMDIPYAETRSYKEQAAAIGLPAAVRAVANANGCNRISIIIPCHRVIGNNGTLTGYGGGLWRKKWLFDHEKKHIQSDK